MHRAAIFVSPTKYEPFGLDILEAAKAGCALCVSDIETLRELWSGTASFFNAENSDEAQEKIIQLIENEEMRKENSAKSRESAQEFSSQKMGAAYMNLYRQLVKTDKIETHPLSHSL